MIKDKLINGLLEKIEIDEFHEGKLFVDNRDFLLSIEVILRVEVGFTFLNVKDILNFQRGVVIELNKSSRDDLDLFVLDKKIGLARSVSVDDKLGVEVTSLY